MYTSVAIYENGWHIFLGVVSQLQLQEYLHKSVWNLDS